MINTEVKVTLRRRIADKLCKDEGFLDTMIGVAIEEGAIKHSDILTHQDTVKLLGYTPVSN